MPRGRLAEIEAHQDPDIVDRFVDEFDLPRADAEEIFTETRRWVWLCAEAREDRKAGIAVPRLYIDGPLLFIDEGWHNWLLHTQKYREFCEHHFGFFVDHVPTPKRVKDVRKAQLAADASALEETLRLREVQYGYIFDKLGGETLEHWYAVLSEKYESLGAKRRK